MVRISAETTFIVTGGASGLGEAVTRALVARGAQVCVFDINQDAGHAMATELKPSVLFQRVDVVSEDSVKKALDAASKFGTIRGVIQAAGIGTPMRVLSKSGNVHSLDHFQKLININLVGTFNVLRLVVQHMAKLPSLESDERGIFINVASVAAFDGQIGLAAYAASKGGVVAMTLPIARELGSNGIRVNTIAPGVFATPMVSPLPAKAQKSLVNQIPFPARFGKPDEFAQLCISMIENQYINGTVIRIDGSIRMAAL